MHVGAFNAPDGDGLSRLKLLYNTAQRSGTGSLDQNTEIINNKRRKEGKKSVFQHTSATLGKLMPEWKTTVHLIAEAQVHL